MLKKLMAVMVMVGFMLVVQWAEGANFRFNVTKAGTGSGTVVGETIPQFSTDRAATLINCGSDCSEESYYQGLQMTLKATPSTGSVFAGWSGGGCSGTNPSCFVRGINANTTITATFNKKAGRVTLPPGTIKLPDVNLGGLPRVDITKLICPGGDIVSVQGKSWCARKATCVGNTTHHLDSKDTRGYIGGDEISAPCDSCAASESVLPMACPTTGQKLACLQGHDICMEELPSNWKACK